MSINYKDSKLKSLGERRIVKELIAPRFPKTDDQLIGIGDDCAVLLPPPPGQHLVMTTDPCPTPVICQLETPNFYHYGRLTVLINVSDLASMGAKPLGMVVSTVMPEDMKVGEYESFLDGLVEASNEWLCPIIGGNIKDGPNFTATASALGTAHKECLMSRVGAKPGDRICVMGEMGIFWSAVISRLLDIEILNPSDNDLLNRSLYKPDAKVQEGIQLSERMLVTSCMDSSDGISGCLQELALVNNVDIIVDSQALVAHPVVSYIARETKIDVRKLLFSWGNWELVFTVDPQKLPLVIQLAKELDTPFFDIGEIRSGNGKVLLDEEGEYGSLTNFASERFSKTSYFTHGLEAYLDFLRNEPLVSVEF